MSIIHTLKPGASKRQLLFTAAIAWTFAGGVLLYKGFSLIDSTTTYLGFKIAASITGGALFYWLLFAKLSLKHTNRIVKLTLDRPCMFSFFNFRSYLLMTIMITSGILLRKFGVIPPQYLLMVYITMGIPLFLSSFRFYYYGIYYKMLVKGC